LREGGTEGEGERRKKVAVMVVAEEEENICPLAYSHFIIGQRIF
jgi:hypothetical protein